MKLLNRRIYFGCVNQALSVYFGNVKTVKYDWNVLPETSFTALIEPSYRSEHTARIVFLNADI